ncbi:MAG: hypothetical protein N4A54_06450 [Peptostreptococcaceae bacterium]|jgi:hypothetical protein|nr:hypothetical protein [Peptostreptococcaceae bacterium]
MKVEVDKRNLSFFIISLFIIFSYFYIPKIDTKVELEKINLLNQNKIITKDSKQIILKNDDLKSSILYYFDIIVKGEFEKNIEQISIRELKDKEIELTLDYIKNIKKFNIINIDRFDLKKEENIAGISVSYEVVFKDYYNKDNILRTQNYILKKDNNVWKLKDKNYNWDESVLLLGINQDESVQRRILLSKESLEAQNK